MRTAIMVGRGIRSKTSRRVHTSFLRCFNSGKTRIVLVEKGRQSVEQIRSSRFYHCRFQAQIVGRLQNIFSPIRNKIA